MSALPLRVAPSILSADFGRLADEVQAITAAGADLVHVDVMDGHFVPNLTIGPPVVAAIRKATRLPLDVHLMITNADQYLEAFVDAGADIISVHEEACTHLHRTVQRIKQLGKLASVALNPHTPPETLRYLIEDLDMVLVMTVNPGFGGQSMIASALAKIAPLRAMAGKHPLAIEVDGGVNLETIAEVAAAGADSYVSGSAVFGSSDYSATIAELRQTARQHYR